MRPSRIEVWSLSWPEIGPGDDLARLLAAAPDLRDGDIAVITSKVVSKAEGRLVPGDRAPAVAAETRRVVARRGGTVIAETSHGLVLAAAGVDSSNVPPGTSLLLPTDPDRTARRIRAELHRLRGCSIGVIVSDTAGRAWRIGQTDLAIGCAGLAALVDLSGQLDTHGNLLRVTAPAVADELAAAADLVKGKTTGRPLAVIRGLGSLVLPIGDDGPGARGLVRSPDQDLFALGARDAVAVAALRSDSEALARFPARVDDDPDPFEGLSVSSDSDTAGAGSVRASIVRDECPGAAAGRPTRSWTLRIELPTAADQDELIACGRLLERAATLAAAHRLTRHPHPSGPEDSAWLTSCWQDLGHGDPPR